MLHSESLALYKVVHSFMDYFLCLCWLVGSNQQSNSVILWGKTLLQLICLPPSNFQENCVVFQSLKNCKLLPGRRCYSNQHRIEVFWSLDPCSRASRASHVSLRAGVRREKVPIVKSLIIMNSPFIVTVPHQLFGNSITWYSVQIGELNFCFLVESGNCWSCESLLIEMKKYLRKSIEK